MSEKASEKSEMSTVEFCQRALKAEIAPSSIGSVQARIRHAAQELRWSYTRTKDTWYTVARAVPTSVNGLSLSTMGISALGDGLGMDHNAPHGGSLHDDKSWAKKSLKKLLGMTNAARQARYRHYNVYQMDPDTASLRSMSLSAKMSRTKRLQYSRKEELDKSYYRGVIEGYIDD